MSKKTKKKRNSACYLCKCWYNSILNILIGRNFMSYHLSNFIHIAFPGWSCFQVQCQRMTFLPVLLAEIESIIAPIQSLFSAGLKYNHFVQPYSQNKIIRSSQSIIYSQCGCSFFSVWLDLILWMLQSIHCDWMDQTGFWPSLGSSSSC